MSHFYALELQVSNGVNWKSFTWFSRQFRVMKRPFAFYNPYTWFKYKVFEPEVEFLERCIAEAEKLYKSGEFKHVRLNSHLDNLWHPCPYVNGKTHVYNNIGEYEEEDHAKANEVVAIVMCILLWSLIGFAIYRMCWG